MTDDTHHAIMAVLAQARVRADLARGELDATIALRRGLVLFPEVACAQLAQLLASSVPAAYAAGYVDVVLEAVTQ